MKKIIILIILFTTIKIYAQTPDGTINTPKGNSVEYYNNSVGDTVSFWAYTDSLIDANSWDATIIAPATYEYNCHSYAFHVSEGEDECWINAWDYGDIDVYSGSTPMNTPTNLNEYWASNGGYHNIYSEEAYAKSYYGSQWVWDSYYERWVNLKDHSAVVDSNTDYFISKWGPLPLVRHEPEDCPYYATSLSYYRLDYPVISGSTGILCDNSQRVFSENTFTDIDLDYDWSVSNNLDEVSGDGTSSYTVEGTSTYGEGEVTLEITTPSGYSKSTDVNFLVGAPDAPYNILCVYCYQYCVGQEYIFQVEDYNDLFTTSYYWSVNYAGHITYGQGGPSVSVYMDYPYQADISVYAYNTCGSSSVTHKYVSVSNCGRSLTVYPNPAADELTFSMDDSQELSKDAVYEIYDNNMNKLVAEPLKSKEKTINISGLKKGLYYISVYTNGELITEKFMKD
ncbi:MAG TPA: T9SS type A sorting domain-containing protein [Draconibacterium sp.]|nr:T9SS type A sorting domain-containing protein [Draconibacterium sp.]